ncbi:MAG TPA: SRPBCC domain-containing protein [Steroidobacter sp.]
MPVKKDQTGKRWVEMELSVPGTPEQVWQAIATGPGYTAWFTPTTIDERVGGVIRFDMGEHGESKGEVTAWEPPSRFAYVERDWGEGAPPLATEITVTATSGDQCVIRMVHSLFASTDDWDDQMEGFECGWRGFFKVLRLYLSHFAGMKAAVAFARTSAEAPQADVWQRLAEGLNLARANAGKEWTVRKPERMSGMIEHLEHGDGQCYAVLRMSEPGPGVALIGSYGMDNSTYVVMTFYLYGEDAKQRAVSSEPVWRNWSRDTLSTISRSHG